MHIGGSSVLKLSIAVLAAITVLLPNRATVCGGPSIHLALRQSIAAQTILEPGPTRAPVRAPVCRLRCREFIANVSEAPPQTQAAHPFGLEVHSAYSLPAPGFSATRPVIAFFSETSPPVSEVLRL
jgi:hypothetical protein